MKDYLGAACSHSVDGVHVLPVLHERLEFADLVRGVLRQQQPDGVVIELPSSLERTWRRGIERLPSISVLLFGDRAGRTVYFPIQPADPLVEASRWCIERGVPLALGDIDADGYADYRDRVPDSYALLRLGARRIRDLHGEHPHPRDPLDDRREASLAYHARVLRDHGAAAVLVVCGMHHARGVADALKRPQATPLARPVRRDARLVHLHPESLGEVLAEVPFYAAVYEARRKAVPLEPEPAKNVAAGRTYGPFRVLSGGGGDDPERLSRAVARAAREAGCETWEAFTGHETKRGGREPGPLDRLRLQWALLRGAEDALVASAPDETVQPWQRTNLARYSRNLARLSGNLIVDLFDLLVAARGCVSENFAWETHRLATAYPAQSESAADLPVARIRADEMFDGTRRIRLSRARKRRKRAPWTSLRRRRDERWPGEWLEGFDDASICSYPPEDIVVENFGRFLKKRGRRLLSEERSRSVPFTTSVLDGIDVRETIRHWHDKQIYVRELGRVPGSIDSVVVIFDDEDLAGEQRYPNCQTWLGEHEQESDMAYYSTDPTQGIVGPGICRVTYGGFVLCSPPRRMAEVWSDADYRFLQRKSEVLLLAALDYSEEETVVYAAPTAPRPLMARIAARLGRKILYVPLGSLSPPTLKKMRVMHILAGYDKREIAEQYIW